MGVVARLTQKYKVSWMETNISTKPTIGHTSTNAREVPKRLANKKSYQKSPSTRSSQRWQDHRPRDQVRHLRRRLLRPKLRTLRVLQERLPSLPLTATRL